MLTARGMEVDEGRGELEARVLVPRIGGDGTIQQADGRGVVARLQPHDTEVVEGRLELGVDGDCLVVVPGRGSGILGACGDDGEVVPAVLVGC